MGNGKSSIEPWAIDLDSFDNNKYQSEHVRNYLSFPDGSDEESRYLKITLSPYNSYYFGEPDNLSCSQLKNYIIFWDYMMSDIYIAKGIYFLLRKGCGLKNIEHIRLMYLENSLMPYEINSIHEHVKRMIREHTPLRNIDIVNLSVDLDYLELFQQQGLDYSNSTINRILYNHANYNMVRIFNYIVNTNLHQIILYIIQESHRNYSNIINELLEQGKINLEIFEECSEFLREEYPQIYRDKLSSIVKYRTLIQNSS